MNRKTLSFGHYPMDAEGKELLPIEWILLKSSGDLFFLLSRDILDYKEFSNVENNNWDESPLRKWLNSEFLDRAFDAKEKERLLEVDEGEKVSLLSVAEVREYFASNTKGLRAKYSDYARDKTKNIYGDVCDGVYGFYWLRSANKNLTKADLANPWQKATPEVYVYHVTNRGALNGYRRANSKDGVRPLICIKK